MSFSIGMTEGNDPSFSSSWFDRALNCNGAIIITKNLNRHVRENVLRLFDILNGHVIVHCTCTGFGGTLLEPNVPIPSEQADNLQRLIQEGFPPDNTVFRIDPIVPSPKGLSRFDIAFNNLVRLNERLIGSGKGCVTRVRVSILDNYNHVIERFRQAGLPPLYNGNFRASPETWQSVKEHIDKALSLSAVPISLELCAEDGFADYLGASLSHSTNGCLSEKDLRIMGFTNEEIESAVSGGQNAQCREGCHCLSCKKELIPTKGRCPHQCLYCYWRDKPSNEVDGQLHF